MNIVRASTTDDGIGGKSLVDETPVHSDLPCRINWSRGREKLMFGKNDYLRDAKVYCRVVSDVLVSDVVVIKSVRYNIVGIVDIDEVNKQMVMDIIKIAE